MRVKLERDTERERKRERDVCVFEEEIGEGY